MIGLGFGRELSTRLVANRASTGCLHWRVELGFFHQIRMTGRRRTGRPVHSPERRRQETDHNGENQSKRFHFSTFSFPVSTAMAPFAMNVKIKTPIAPIPSDT